MEVLIPPPFTNAMSAPRTFLYASAQRSPRFVSWLLIRRFSFWSAIIKSTSVFATTLFSSSLYFALILSTNFVMSASFSFATSAPTYSAVIVPFSAITILPMFSSFVPVATILMDFPSLFFTLFTTVLCACPSMRTSMPFVFLITSMDVHGALALSSPKCATATT